MRQVMIFIVSFVLYPRLAAESYSPTTFDSAEIDCRGQNILRYPGFWLAVGGAMVFLLYKSSSPEEP